MRAIFLWFYFSVFDWTKCSVAWGFKGISEVKNFFQCWLNMKNNIYPKYVYICKIYLFISILILYLLLYAVDWSAWFCAIKLKENIGLFTLSHARSSGATRSTHRSSAKQTSFDFLLPHSSNSNDPFNISLDYSRIKINELSDSLASARPWVSPLR